jgi:hypothetical protein
MMFAQSIPLWFVWLILVVLFFAALELGRRCRRSQTRDGRSSDAKNSGLVLPASLGLLSLLISFTFSLALSRYDTRRDLTVKESIAIRTLVDKSGLLPIPLAIEMRKRALTYVDLRLTLFRAGTSIRQVNDARAGSWKLQAAMWGVAAQMLSQPEYSLQARALIDAISAVSSASVERESAGEEHLPPYVLYLLVLFSTLGAAMVGYALGPATSNFAVPEAIYVVMIATTILLIWDLDRPHGGGVQVSQAPMITLRTDLGQGLLDSRSRYPSTDVDHPIVAKPAVVPSR